MFDAGTGIRELGSRLVEQDRYDRIDLMFTHVHYDHVEGVPFFAPFFVPHFRVNVWMGHVDGAKDTEDAMKGLMRRPYFPVGPDIFTASIGYRKVKAHSSFDLGDGIKVTTAPLNHPGGATAFRIDYAGRSFAFVTDTEHVPGKLDRNIVDLIEGVDSFAYDASLTDEEMADFAGYGHSSWEEGIRLMKAAGAGAFYAIHHMPYRTDQEVDQIEAAIKAAHGKSGVAREGATLKL